MSLDICLIIDGDIVYESNITHNLTKMASEAKLCDALWFPDELGVTKASQLIDTLEEGLAALKENPEYFEQFNASNGWGKYKHFVPFVEDYLKACRKHPDAEVRVGR